MVNTPNITPRTSQTQLRGPLAGSSATPAASINRRSASSTRTTPNQDFPFVKGRVPKDLSKPTGAQIVNVDERILIEFRRTNNVYYIMVDGDRRNLKLHKPNGSISEMNDVAYALLKLKRPDYEWWVRLGDATICRKYHHPKPQKGPGIFSQLGNTLKGKKKQAQ